MNRKTAILALLLLVPAPSLGVLFGMVVFPDSLAGGTLFGASKLWLFGLPLFWLRVVERGRFSWSPPRNGGFVAGILSGLVISGLILAVYAAAGAWLVDKRGLAGKLVAIGLGSACRYRSIWPGYVSHALVDLCVFGIGAVVLFGAR
jgi:hypothetical protein